MKTMILYSSKYGCTADCAKLLQMGLPGSTELANIDQINSKTFSLEPYDTVIMGSSIYIGAISKKMRLFCHEHMEVLGRKRVGIFLCCGTPSELSGYLSKNFPAELLKHAVTVTNFGGEARMDQLKGIDRLVMKIATKGNEKSLNLSHENIAHFIKEIGGFDEE